jgi:hypothetical protein
MQLLHYMTSVEAATCFEFMLFVLHTCVPYQLKQRTQKATTTAEHLHMHF